MDLLSRFRGSLLGLAAGDALGTTLEFKPPGSFLPISDMTGGGPFRLNPGEWTDDTATALCLAESLIECRQFDPVDQLDRYLRWYREGHLSSTGWCFDIGKTTRVALQKFEATRQPHCGSGDLYTASNGSMMRLAPVPMFYALQPDLAIEMSGESSLTTHSLQITTDACRYLGGLIAGALNGASKEELLSPLYAPIAGYWSKHSLHTEILEVAAGSYKIKQPPEIEGSGYVTRSLEAALWGFYHTTTFRDGALMVANLGNDADTNAAIYGQLAGAFYGEEGIPAEWREKLALRETIEGFAGQLYECARANPHQP